MLLATELLFSSLFLLVGNQPHQFTMEDLLKYKCDNGKQQACEQLEQLAEEKKSAKFLGERVAIFGEELKRRNLMLDEKRPDLEAAYPLVMHDYFAAQKQTGQQQTLVDDAFLSQCAAHYHNYWLNKKLWWPNDEGKPDWESIYVFIVDHYYGFCLKSL